MSRYLLLILSFFSFICFTAYAQQKDIDVFSEIERIEKALELGEISEKEADAKIEELLGKSGRRNLMKMTGLKTYQRRRKKMTFL